MTMNEMLGELTNFFVTRLNTKL